MSPDQALLDIKLDFVGRWAAGERPTISDYIKQYPQWADELASFAVNFATSLIEPDDEEEDCDDAGSNAMALAIQEASKSVEGVHLTLINDIERTTISDCIDAIGAGVDDYAEAMNIPVGIATMVVRGTIYEWPRKLIERTARFCRISFDAVEAIISTPVLRIQSLLLRSRGEGTGGPRQQRTFREAMLLYKRDGELTAAQALDWREEIGE